MKISTPYKASTNSLPTAQTAPAGGFELPLRQPLPLPTKEIPIGGVHNVPTFQGKPLHGPITVVPNTPEHAATIQGDNS